MLAVLLYFKAVLDIEDQDILVNLRYSGLKCRNLSFQHDNDTKHKPRHITNPIFDSRASVLKG
ncbi:hypothetical protein RO3G_12003 [Rhizopus delemar RA 99-880]|uniref:Uncharacterized protein n=1 Tax=Rhizopus delemar (strain RA 99-880 / ATCC MYA-4621 / FGSC 9543 / NRRL 43880) TaxID=246409 RepID=I1CFR2_RHIO9|nr:hypothetical protein RO3G_12003 [Rhizopus delemar RA 99-880]|eukprot:EIE87292.1 hypothetical protein RO3G_12003 [Rhizopus delemar RA 99-880]